MKKNREQSLGLVSRDMVRRSIFVTTTLLGNHKATYNTIGYPGGDSKSCHFYKLVSIFRMSTARSATPQGLPTYSEGVRFQFDGKLHTNDFTVWSSQLRLSIFGADGELLVDPSELNA